MSTERLHFIGVGGVGMSGIAHVAHDQGMVVTGSDIKESRYTKQLKSYGIPVAIGQAAENVPEGDDATVVISTAILDNNPELEEARRRNLNVIHRAQMLARLGERLDTLAVAGTHGKTTTSSMLASTLDGMGLDPTFLIGGIVRSYGTNAHSGTGKYYVVEADESDKSFTFLSPAGVIVTNIEADHLDHYKDLGEIFEKFKQFMASVPEDGPVVVCGEEEALVCAAREVHPRAITYGLGEECDARVVSYGPHGVGSSFTLERRALPWWMITPIILPRSRQPSPRRRRSTSAAFTFCSSRTATRARRCSPRCSTTSSAQRSTMPTR